MEAVHERDGQTERIEFTRSASPVLMIFSILPAIVAVQTLIVLVMHPIPLTLMALMLVAVGCCAALSVLFVDQILPVKLTLAPDGLHVARTWGSAVYPWSTIDAAKVVGATGSLGDDPTKASNQRFGLGLFIRIGSGPRDLDDNPDIVLYTGDENDAAHLIRMTDHINAYRSKLGGKKTTVKKFGGTAPKAGRLRQATA